MNLANRPVMLSLGGVAFGPRTSFLPQVAFAPEGGEGGGGNGGGNEGGGSDNRAGIDMNAASGGSDTPFVVDATTGLSGDNLKIATDKGWLKDGKLDVTKALGSYREAEGRLGKSIVPPAENASAEEIAAFYGKLGRPEKASDYGITLNREGLPEGFAYNEAASAEFANWAHGAGLTKSQAQSIHDQFVKYQANDYAAYETSQAKLEEGAFDDLAKAWGGADSAGFKQNLEFAGRAMRELGLRDDLVASGIVSSEGQIRNSRMAQALARVGKEMFSEDSYTTGSGPSAGTNPWTKEGENLTLQGELVRKNPAKAAAFIRQAGLDPAMYGINA